MWGKKKQQITRINSLISNDTIINGDIIFSGGLHIDGKVKGDISSSNNNEEHILTLGKDAIIEGEIKAAHIIINGTVIGDVHACEHVELAREAHITGNVYYGLFKMEVGAEVNGSLIHTNEPVQASKCDNE
jgi:cytoskeletal protein CcmA (bactofilin family)